MRATFGRRAQPICRRALKRENVMLAGSALAMTRSRSIVICDLSSCGAALNGRDLPPAGEEFLFVAGSTERMADVVWLAGDKCGVRFDEPIEADDIARMKREVQWESVVGCWR